MSSIDSTSPVDLKLPCPEFLRRYSDGEGGEILGGGAMDATYESLDWARFLPLSMSFLGFSDVVNFGLSDIEGVCIFLSVLRITFLLVVTVGLSKCPVLPPVEPVSKVEVVALFLNLLKRLVVVLGGAAGRSKEAGLLIVPRTRPLTESLGLISTSLASSLSLSSSFSSSITRLTELDCDSIESPILCLRLLETKFFLEP